MADWGQADDSVIRRSHTAEAYIPCEWLTYAMDAHCYICVG